MSHQTTSSPLSPTPVDRPLTRSQRLDRLPFTRKHGKILGASGIGWALDAMDVGLISFVIAALSVHWELSKADGSLIASAGFAGMAIGASVGGLLADRIGRRSVFALTLLVYGLATGASALAMGVGALIVLRFIVGLGLGAELPVASTLMSEFAPARIRGRVIVWLEAFWALGWILAAVIGTFVAASGPTGWRWALAIGLVPAVYSLVIRLGVPESVRFLEQKGRHEEAEKVVRELESAAGIDAPKPRPHRTKRHWSRRRRSRRRSPERTGSQPMRSGRSPSLTRYAAMRGSGRRRCADAPRACGPCGSASTCPTTGRSSGSRPCWWTAASPSPSPSPSR
ncbi:MFS transporter [Brachybacterium sp. Z12]|uniref:MFS transporter n=1 Tax=Brachybacterium sp. Z12 TaxID=2759167 RepID=UPI0037BE64B1